MSILRSIAAAIAVIALSCAFDASAHDIYTGVHGKDGQLCCGGTDCAATLYREKGGAYEFMTRDNRWVRIPQERITFLPIPDDPPSNDNHHAHLCYREPTSNDSPEKVFDGIFLYCAFIPPGAA